MTIAGHLPTAISLGLPEDSDGRTRGSVLQLFHDPVKGPDNHYYNCEFSEKLAKLTCWNRRGTKSGGGESR